VRTVNSIHTRHTRVRLSISSNHSSSSPYRF
jgi:hypothetical protein